ncbi:flavodoxin [Campylobacter hyointestinalis]|uniref:flavodoxin n=1 Tax=Campylobacter hyointestinalis TaxID=198 RepID=UPI000CE2EAD2|nr:flavodoxin [Campylobacter hyointestinalis]PPB74453.1 flavodoxin [Campylobacter hyointestinalis subsp. hyointestinalis]PPB75020.1 flavodoxin [Campylobacter hyointestinalis subsp. hyointestinalis]PPB77693.1 flavodoxin [Campylobacter hyointestinalis subsp. hyointestinalis]PPB78718.1 flavodoxin [Campylobacter hyointestinalis subsp. hyointestinalis]
MNKILVAYFSASGQTMRLAKTIAEVSGGDIYEITPTQKYTSLDLDWHDSNSRSSVEMRKPDSRPSISNLKPNLDGYDSVFIGFPIWWYEAPRIIQTFLESFEWSGKNIVVFATSGGSGLGQSVEILKKSCNANFKDAKVLSSSTNSASIKKWLESLGI